MGNKAQGGDASAGDVENPDTPSSPRSVLDGDSKSEVKASRAGSRPASQARSFSSSSGSESDSDGLEHMELGKRSQQFKPEQVEEIIMMTGLKQTEIAKLFKKFFTATKNSPNPALMTREVFLELPEIKPNPLRERLAFVFGFDSRQHRKGINFAEFARQVSVFTERGPKGEKVKAAFQMYDLDNQNFITRENLKAILQLIIGFDDSMPQDKQDEVRILWCSCLTRRQLLDKAVENVFSEASSHRELAHLSYDDFHSVGYLLHAVLTDS